MEKNNPIANKSRLFRYLNSGEIKPVLALIRKNPELLNEIHVKTGMTPIMYFAIRNQCDEVKRLIDLGSHLNIQDNEGHTALMLSSRLGNHKVVQLLIEGQVDVNLMARDSYTALMYAVKYASNKCIKLLLEANSYIYYKPTLEYCLKNFRDETLLNLKQTNNKHFSEEDLKSL